MLRILLVGHGNMPIPPVGWGAVESLIWDYSVYLKKLGHSVNILNLPIDQVDSILDHIHNKKYDVIHIHNDILVNILHLIPKTLPVLLSSHYPYIHDPSQWADPITGYDYGCYVMTPLLKAVQQKRVHIVAVSQKDRDAFVSYSVPRESVSVCVNGMDTSKFILGPLTTSGSMICMAQIIRRKRQHLFKDLDFIKCAGKINDKSVLPSQEQFVGEWSDDKYHKLTEYSGGILLSDGENGTPLGIKESLAAGLGLVVSEAVASEIPKEWSWVTVIPESKIGDQAYLREACQKIMKIAEPLKARIRAEAEALWDWSVLVPTYVEVLRRVIGERTGL
jgi:glycosyltransferase involved in cell wall biosynthesis